ncbi:PAS domain-containing protein [Echinicola jeungdonensis]|uniref:PAS domain-containing protein n=1 Tax=Echinicola jeungdonensis TaxID=709343 RepID=UPI0025B510B5|nr:PAS domain-containing protein [Echinicola jeungdonensis]MDN3670323.1 PAS domain-containing protein [Echinicola jeungdonensis]
MNFLNQRFDALVLTDRQETILWASPGFEKMTDYHVFEAIGKNPSFLQGKDSSYKAKTQIRKKINEGKPFSSQLINYKKNGEPYLCEITIIPLEDPKGKITHFLALENEI